MENNFHSSLLFTRVEDIVNFFSNDSRDLGMDPSRIFFGSFMIVLTESSFLLIQLYATETEE